MSQLGHFRKSAVVSARSVLPSGTDIISRAGHVRLVPILLQKYFWGGKRKFLETLMRFTRGDVGDHIVSSKIDHGAS
jgi:hypothetical protein